MHTTTSGAHAHTRGSSPTEMLPAAVVCDVQGKNVGGNAVESYPIVFINAYEDLSRQSADISIVYVFNTYRVVRTSYVMINR